MDKNKLALAAAALSFVTMANAAFWSSTSLEVLVGDSYEYGDTRKSSTVLTFEHADGWEFGDNSPPSFFDNTTHDYITPGTFTVSRPMSDIILPMFRPSSASGVAQPAMTSSMVSGSRLGTDFTRCLITSAARSSGRVNLNTPRGALPTAVRNPATMYAFIGKGV